MTRSNLRRWVYILSIVACLSTGTAIAVISGISYWRPIEWAHLPTATANWLIEFRMAGGAFYIGASHFGIGYVPWFLPFLLVSVWPLIAAVLFLMKRRRTRRGFEIAA